jgi:hypothetical protein
LQSHIRLLKHCNIVEGRGLPKRLLHTSKAAEDNLSTAQELPAAPRTFSFLDNDTTHYLVVEHHTVAVLMR